MFVEKTLIIFIAVIARCGIRVIFKKFYETVVVLKAALLRDLYNGIISRGEERLDTVKFQFNDPAF